jgi:response regulator of citrate/malate metabolism
MIHAVEDATVTVLFVDDDKEMGKFVEVTLRKVPGFRFHMITKEMGEDALKEVETNKVIDLVIMDYFLPDLNGIQVSKRIIETHPRLPIIILSANSDMKVAIEAIRLGVADYLLKEELNSALFTQAVLGALQKQKLLREYSRLEVKKRRLEALQEMVITITVQVEQPLNDMRSILNEFVEEEMDERGVRYLQLMKDNLSRIEQKLEKLKNLKDDKTVQYIKDIKMIDLS